ncbi:UNVERIFIED_CONTAM: Serine/threonine-protein phosphatase 2A regulatory subunit B'' subunit alpha [Siphonaria sp. JEL0065]|nr:Serine/threonine-protein phosphatase 2A regulatory subunit B'' subunit alpha [Siphonaria sp. JEL0065]
MWDSHTRKLRDLDVLADSALVTERELVIRTHALALADTLPTYSLSSSEDDKDQAAKCAEPEAAEAESPSNSESSLLENSPAQSSTTTSDRLTLTAGIRADSGIHLVSTDAADKDEFLTPRSSLDLELDLITCLDFGLGNNAEDGDVDDDVDGLDSDVESTTIGSGQSQIGAAVDKQRQQMQSQQRQRERKLLQQKQQQDEIDAVAWLPDRKPTLELMTDLRECFKIERASSSPSQRLPNVLYRDELWGITTVLCVPRYCSMALFDKIYAFAKTDGEVQRPSTVPPKTEENGQVEEEENEKHIQFQDVERWWTDLAKTYHDDHAIVFKIMQKSNKQIYLTPQDFQPVVDEVVQRHPGLEFLSTLAVFQARYAETVITRIFYAKLHNCNERMTLVEFRKHVFLELLIKLQLDDDINATRDVFSYKHFYVIYCKFWELDTDHNMIIEANDMIRYDRGALTEMMMKRVVGGHGKPLSLGNASRQISYKDFIWFMLCVEDKRKVGSIEYWFRCLDFDGDGILSLHELREFYNQQVKRMIDYRMSEPWKLDDFVCSLLDLIKPKNPHYLTLSDLKRTPQNAALFFDMLFDLRKYDNHVRRIDPMYREMDDVWIEEAVVVSGTAAAVAGGGGGDGAVLRRVKLQGWDKFAERAYDMLAYEEAGGGGSSNGNGGDGGNSGDGNGGGGGGGNGGGYLDEEEEEDMEGGHWSCLLGPGEEDDGDENGEDDDEEEDEEEEVDGGGGGIVGWASELGGDLDEGGKRRFRKSGYDDEDDEEGDELVEAKKVVEEKSLKGVKKMVTFRSGGGVSSLQALEVVGNSSGGVGGEVLNRSRGFRL